MMNSFMTSNYSSQEIVLLLEIDGKTQLRDHYCRSWTEKKFQKREVQELTNIQTFIGQPLSLTQVFLWHYWASEAKFQFQVERSAHLLCVSVVPYHDYDQTPCPIVMTPRPIDKCIRFFPSFIFNLLKMAALRFFQSQFLTWPQDELNNWYHFVYSRFDSITNCFPQFF